MDTYICYAILKHLFFIWIHFHCCVLFAWFAWQCTILGACGWRCDRGTKRLLSLCFIRRLVSVFDCVNVWEKDDNNGSSLVSPCPSLCCAVNSFDFWSRHFPFTPLCSRVVCRHFMHTNFPLEEKKFDRIWNTKSLLLCWHMNSGIWTNYTSLIYKDFWTSWQLRSVYHSFWWLMLSMKRRRKEGLMLTR